MIGMHGPPPGPSSNRYNNPQLQHTSMVNQQQQQSGQQQGQSANRSQRGPTQHHQSSGPGRTGGTMKDLQAKQRAELLQNVQSFLNPSTNSKVPMSPKKEVAEEINTNNDSDTKEDKENNNTKDNDSETKE